MAVSATAAAAAQTVALPGEAFAAVLIAGLVPVAQDSGRIAGNLNRPQRYNRRLRHDFYMAAFSSINADGPSRAFYQRKRSQRLTHTQALLALARHLADVLWALLRDGRLFTPAPPAARAAWQSHSDSSSLRCRAPP